MDDSYYSSLLVAEFEDITQYGAIVYFQLWIFTKASPGIPQTSKMESFAKLSILGVFGGTAYAHSVLLGRSPPPIFSKILVPPFLSPLHFWKFFSHLLFTDPTSKMQKRFFPPSETFKRLLLGCHTTDVTQL